MKRLVALALAALGIAACTRVVVLDPAPDSGGGLPDAVHRGDGGGTDGGGVQDAGVIGDAALGG